LISFNSSTLGDIHQLGSQLGPLELPLIPEDDASGQSTNLEFFAAELKWKNLMPEFADTLDDIRKNDPQNKICYTYSQADSFALRFTGQYYVTRDHPQMLIKSDDGCVVTVNGNRVYGKELLRSCGTYERITDGNAAGTGSSLMEGWNDIEIVWWNRAIDGGDRGLGGRGKMCLSLVVDQLRGIRHAV
jgi:hypothetical protein